MISRIIFWLTLTLSLSACAAWFVTSTMASRESRDSREEKKKKKEKEKEGERFDPNIDADLVKTPSSSSSNSNSSRGGNDSGNQNQNGDHQQSDLFKLGQIFQQGFKDVSKTFADKLDDVSKTFSSGLHNLQTNLDNRMTELSELRGDSDDQALAGEDCGADGDGWGNDSFMSDTRRDHDISDSSSVKSQGKQSYFKKKNVPPPSEKVGDEVDQDLADIANRAFRKPCPSDDFKKFKEKYVRPKNVEWITAPEIPFNIYRRLSGDFKNTDSALRVVQEQLVPVASSLVVALDKLGDGDMNGGMDTLSETLQGFGYVFRTNLTDKRRNLLKPKLPEDFKMLATERCDPSPVNLLGDISENTKKMSETDKITAQMDKSYKGKEKSTKRFSQSGRGKPYDRNSSSSSSHSFSNRRGGFFGRRWDNQRRYNNDSKSDYKSNNSSNFRRGGQSRK